MAEYKVTHLVGTPTDYSDKNNWAHLPQNADKDVDVFFVYPTVFIDPRPGAPEIAPIDNPVMRANVQGSYPQQAQVFEGLANVYEPYYRQSNLCALLKKSEEESRAFQLREQRTDIYAAFDYFFEHFNQGKPFILAGHSQGSVMLKIALQDYFQEHVDYLDRMVAAYLIGFSVTTDDLAACPTLKFAEGADDTGVIVSWNTEGPENKDAANVVVLENAISINPLNWKRDDTYAPASENLGDNLPTYGENISFAIDYQVHQPGLADAQLDVERGVVVCTTLPDRYIPPFMPGMVPPFGPASLHLMDYAAYWENIRENVRVRTKAYFDQN